MSDDWNYRGCSVEIKKGSLVAVNELGEMVATEISADELARAVYETERVLMRSVLNNAFRKRCWRARRARTTKLLRLRERRARRRR